MKLRELLGNEAAIEPAVAALDVTGIALDSRVVKPGDMDEGGLFPTYREEFELNWADSRPVS